MAKQYQFRRGTETDHLTFNGVAGELSIDTTNDVLRLHDGHIGAPFGGIPLLRADLTNLAEGSFTIDLLGPGDPDTFIVFNSSGEPEFQPTLDGSFILDSTLSTDRLVADISGDPNRFATTDSNGNFVFKAQLSAEFDFANESVTLDKIADDAVTGDKIVKWTILTDSLATDSITTDKLKNNAITSEKIDDGAVLSATVAASQITNEKIQDSAISSDKIKDGNVTGAKIQNGAVFAGNFNSATAGNSLGRRFTSEDPPVSNSIGNDGDIFYVLGDPVPQIFNVFFLKEAYNEGETGAINVLALSGGFAGLTVPYTITGIQSSDISIPLTGNFVLGANLQASIPFAITDDISTGEGDEIMVLIVPGGVNTATATIFDTSTTAFEANIIISTDTQNFDARTALINAGWNGIQKTNSTIIVDNNVVVGSNAITGAAFVIDNIPEGSTINVTNNGTIAGTGGDGGGNGGGLNFGGGNGQTGGNAFQVTDTTGATITLINNGVIGGGGGGGGGGNDSSSGTTSPGGGGGAGRSPGLGRGTGATDGTLLLGGQGSPIGVADPTGGGGRGGNLGQAGLNGVGPSPGSAGGAGKAIVGIANITGSIGGDVRGAQI